MARSLRLILFIFLLAYGFFWITIALLPLSGSGRSGVSMSFRRIWALGSALVSAIILADASATAQTKNPNPVYPQFTNPIASDDFQGRVVSSRDLPVTNATVYLVPTTMIDMTPITASDVFDAPYVADAYDEPLEDAIARHQDMIPKAKTDDQGRFRIFGVPDGKFFVYAAIAEDDVEHFPGGDKSRASYRADELRGHAKKIQLSSRPPVDAEYVGSTQCLECHKEHSSWQQTGHKLAWSPPGKPGARRASGFLAIPRLFRGSGRLGDDRGLQRGNFARTGRL